MKNKLVWLFRYVHHFGFFNGLKLFFQIWVLKTEVLELKDYGEIYLRRNSSDTGIFNQIFIEREYNIKFSFEPKFIIDAGANIGLTSLFFSKKFPLATIVALEPEVENFKILKINTKNCLKVISVNNALWSKDGVISLVKSPSYDSHNVSESNNSSDAVCSITISSLLNTYNISRIDILKMDIEGAEKEIFSSDVQNWLPKVKVLVIELHDRYKSGCSMSLFQALSGFDYSMSIKGELLIFEFNNH